MADEPARHVAAVRPARNSDLGFVNKTELLDRFYTGHYVPSWAIARVVVNGSLIGVTQIVAATVVGLENDILSRGQQLRQPTETGCRSRRGSTMDQEYEWVLFIFAEIGWVDENPVLMKTVRTL